ncbi:MAG: arylformamidase [Parcubacteria group bacterium Gr01-1014_48]|nr:MAG: arylformamidase [Parcubacteria group bacterium Greene0416_14]TSC73522.1 MAG: arylformamidase [Parcubacteria group bacterium Gr01-1014_48]TSD00087.1 MAG: arylformamidase [Parcubacteria group bacterium Greene1014_15]TSD07326.1 MAG: arylformamidase [Parcubacteria group bacterium Greene0714_4]
MAIYPGNPKVFFDDIRGATSTLTKLSLGTHTGTHVDAPKHVFEKGVSIDEIPLKVFIGPCRVLDMMHCSDAIRVENLQRYKIHEHERILLKTKNSLGDQEVFSDTHVYLDGDAADYLANISVALLGIDALSVKQRGGKDYRAHTSLLEKNIPIIEGLALRDVPEGRYFFIGIPLRLRGLDGSPVRAVLLEEEHVRKSQKAL